MTDENGEVLVSATGGIDPDVECEADVDVTEFGRDNWTYIKIRVKYIHIGFYGWNRYQVRMYFCTVGKPTTLLECFNIYIYGKQGMLLMTNFIFVIKMMMKASSGTLKVGAIDVFRGTMKSLCYELEKRVRLFNNNYRDVVTSKFDDGEVRVE